MAKPSGRLSAKLLIVSSLVTVIGFSTICASVMLDMRRGVETVARQSPENLASGVEADISRNIELYDLSLRAVAKTKRRGRFRPHPFTYFRISSRKPSRRSGRAMA